MLSIASSTRSGVSVAYGCGAASRSIGSHGRGILRGPAVGLQGSLHRQCIGDGILFVFFAGHDAV